jgi:outer membrane receptor protein involved in Fe transport
MKKQLLFLFCLAANSLFAQSTLTGSVQDSTTQKPLEFATVGVFDTALAKAAKPLQVVFTNTNGVFLFEKLPAGTYNIEVSNVGFKNAIFKNIVLKKESLSQNSNPLVIKMQPTVAQLGVVTVSALRPILERQDEKIIYNADADPSNTGGSTLELLRKVPYISVDGDDNLKIKGSTKYKVKINGKSSGMTAKNPKEALAAFPANTIVRVELITTPSAKDDAEGVQAVINIITKKKLQGYNASVAAGATSLRAYRGNTSLDVKLGDIGISGYGGGQYQEPLKSTDFYDKISDTDTNNPLVFKGVNESFSNNYNYYTNAEIAWDIDTLKTLSLYGSWHNYSNNGLATGTNHFTNKTLDATNFNTSYSKYSSPYTNYGLDYIQKLKGENHELTASVLYNSGGDNSSVDISRREVFPVIAQKYLYNRNISTNIETTGALDYSRPLTKTQSIGVGAKGIFRHINSDFGQYNVNPSTQEQQAIPSQTNIFEYDQNVYALYADYRIKIKKFTLHPGLRAEQTLIDANFKTNKTGVKQDYFTFNPSFSVSYKASEQNNWNLSYSRGISRPLVWFLNPYINNASAQYVSTGNTELSPEVRNNVELEFSTFKNGKNLSLTLYERFTDKVISEYTTLQSDGVSFTKYYNLGQQYETGLSANISGDIFKNMNVNTNIDFIYQTLNSGFGGSTQTNSGITGWLWSSFTYTLPKKYKISANGHYSPGEVLLQGRNGGWWGYTFEATKSFYKESLRFRVFVEAPFHEQRVFLSSSTGGNFTQSSVSYSPARAFGIGIRYKFGQLKEGVSRKRGINNSDGKSK